MMAAALTLALLQQQDTTAGRPCQVAIDTVGHYGRQVEVRKGETNLFAGGGVRAHCQGTTSTLASDSLAWFAGLGRLDLLEGVRIRDTALTLDAVTVFYYLHQERLEAHKNVVATSRSNGSVLRGPNLTYYRVARGVRDTVEMYATSRPTIEYRSGADSAEPYVIVGDRVRMKGNDRMWAGGNVTIDRSDLAARADSMMRDVTAGTSVLVGHPRVEGKGAKSYSLVGRRIELEFQDREVRVIRALGAAQATSADWRLTADTIRLLVARRQLQQAFAWGDSTRPQAARPYRRAHSAAERDWMTGDTITAHWRPAADSSGAEHTVLDTIVARGSARAFNHLQRRGDSTAAPSLNYSRGKVIEVALKGDSIDRVLVTGRADGVQLDPVIAPPASRDTTKGKKK